MKTLTLAQKAQAAGFDLRGSRYAGMSAKQLRAANTQRAESCARFIAENKAELVAVVAGSLSK